MIYRLDSITYISYTVIRKEDNMTEAQKKASAKYDKANTRVFTIKLNYKTDADLIAWLESCQNIQGYIKDVLNKDRRKPE